MLAETPTLNQHLYHTIIGIWAYTYIYYRLLLKCLPFPRPQNAIWRRRTYLDQCQDELKKGTAFSCLPLKKQSPPSLQVIDHICDIGDAFLARVRLLRDADIVNKDKTENCETAPVSTVSSDECSMSAAFGSSSYAGLHMCIISTSALKRFSCCTCERSHIPNISRFN